MTKLGIALALMLAGMNPMVAGPKKPTIAVPCRNCFRKPPAPPRTRPGMPPIRTLPRGPLPTAGARVGRGR